MAESPVETCPVALDDGSTRGLEPWRDEERPPADEPNRRWTRAYADELRGPPLSPAFYTLTPFHGFPQMFFELHGAGRHDLGDRFRYVHASCYADVDLVQHMYEYQPRRFRTSSVLAMLPPDRRGQLASAPFRWPGRLRRMFVMEIRHRRKRSLAHVAARIEALVPEFERRMIALTSRSLAELGDDELSEHADELGAIAGWFGAPCGDAVMFHAVDVRLALVALLEHWFSDGEHRYASVSTGLPGSRTVREAEALHHLVRRIGANPAVAVTFSSHRTWESMLAALRDAGEAALADDLERFRAAHAHRGAHYKDVVHPRWGDRPELLLAALRGSLGGQAESPAQMNRRAGAQRIAAQVALIEKLGGPSAFALRRLLRWLFDLNDTYALVRDDHRFHFDRVWFEHRRILHERGRRLTARGLIEDPDDVFFLGRDELESAWCRAEIPDRRHIAARRSSFEHARRCAGPRFLRGDVRDDGAFDTVGFDSASPVHTGFTGIPASPGIAVGRARVVLDITELERVERDDIVVTRQTDPSWSPVFPRIAGLVLETGGVLAHGASLCREYALPCVTAVARASEQIRDGSRIEIDGARGTVRALESPAVAQADTSLRGGAAHADSH